MSEGRQYVVAIDFLSGSDFRVVSVDREQAESMRRRDVPVYSKPEQAYAVARRLNGESE